MGVGPESLTVNGERRGGFPQGGVRREQARAREAERSDPAPPTPPPHDTWAAWGAPEG